MNLIERPLSYSSIKEFAKSPKHYLEYINKPKFPPTDAMKIGSMVHCMLLQPDLFNVNYVVAPEINKRTNAGKEEWANLLLANEGKEIVSLEDYNLCVRLYEGCIKNNKIKFAINACYDFEQEWKSDIFDLPYRGFYDGVSDEYILEVKTTNDANPKSVMYDFYKRKYHIQAALYYIASGKRIQYLIIESSYPYLSYLAFADDSFINKGYEEVKYLSEEFSKCLESGDFSAGYEHFYDEIKIKLPWSVEN